MNTGENMSSATEATTQAISRLTIPADDAAPDADSRRRLFDKVTAVDGFVINYARAHALNARNAEAIFRYIFGLLGSAARLPRHEQELIAVVVSAENRCTYCLLSHTRQLGQLIGDPRRALRIAANYRHVELNSRERALADFAVRLTRASHEIDDGDLVALRDLGLADEEILEAIEVAALFNYTNRVISALGVLPDERSLKLGA